ncbi:hypothetical protein SAMN02745164_02233 [Marinitoga hydrogenitolerans DSM 16785]|uniref:Uncharacterized protein n=1 Tax=Marinitoga hydrogenitolerans (strain DSM 16785 / JCM 12826 / AT1271) TaxID=1122195 RepID=A0A1M5AN51_MARH1|nr:hypothetical protein [Marinitoga hydrogenitolerans]SHF31698.1 hypothetical protein SAMN02745164_02233 [Marinitoga hydrogenitolerans DSM 16785]
MEFFYIEPETISFSNFLSFIDKNFEKNNFLMINFKDLLSKNKEFNILTIDRNDFIVEKNRSLERLKNNNHRKSVDYKRKLIDFFNYEREVIKESNQFVEKYERRVYYAYEKISEVFVKIESILETWFSKKTAIDETVIIFKKARKDFEYNFYYGKIVELDKKLKKIKIETNIENKTEEITFDLSIYRINKKFFFIPEKEIQNIDLIF